MKAIVCSRYGSPEGLQLQEVKKPQPKANEILLRVHAASITAAECMMRKGTPRYARLFLGLRRLRKPIPGTGFAGVVESVGDAVTAFKRGDAVFGETGFGFSTNAEYVCLPESGLISSLPDNMSYDQAAPVCDGALTSYSFLKDIGKIKPGDRVLINGAAGSLGSAAVQIAKSLGAQVTAVCSGRNTELVKSFGADQVIDYGKQDFTQRSNEVRYDIIYDTVGTLSYSRCRALLNDNGLFLSPVLSLSLLLRMVLTSLTGSKKAKFSATGARPVPELRTLLDEVKTLIEVGRLKSFIDRRYALEDTPLAHAYIDSGHKRGNVVISFEGV